MAVDDTGPSNGTDERSIGARMSDDVTAFSDITSDFYRGEVDRTTAWRARLDQTTNWAVVVVAAILTWSFSSPDHPHYVLLIGVFGVSAFLVMEANRYREYDIWRDRVRTIQEDLYAEVFEPSGEADPGWRSRLSEGLRNPTFTLSYREALTHRLRRSYLALLGILLAAWVARITVFEPSEPWRTTASVFGVSGEVTVVVVVGYYLALFGLTAWSAREARVVEFQE